MLSQVLNVFKRAFSIALISTAVFAASAGEVKAGGAPPNPYQTAWTRQMGTAVYERASCVSSDGSGNVYIAGSADGGLDGIASLGSRDAFVTKYNRAGEKQWTRLLGTSEEDWADGVSADDSGNVYIAGGTSGVLDGSNTGMSDLFVAKYNSAGLLLWVRQLGSTDYDYAYAVSVDGSGNVIAAGGTGAGFDGNASLGDYDFFVVKYNSAGVKQWSRQFGSAGYEEAYGVSADGMGNVYVSGETDGGVDGNTNAGGNDVFLVKYNSAGDRQWTRQFGTAGNDSNGDMTADGLGNTYVTGFTTGDLGGVSAGSWDIYVAKYNTAGDVQWVRQLGSSGQEFCEGVAVDGSGNVYVAGGTSSSLDGNTSAGASDIVVVKYNGAGFKLWTRQTGSSLTEWATGAAVDGSGNVYVAGGTYGGLDGNTNAGGCDIFLMRLVPSPYSEITSPADGASISGTDATITGWSMANSGVAFVQVSTDGGASWQTADGTDTWSFLWSLPTNTTANITSRATDTLGNPQSPSPGVTVLVNMPLAIDSVTADPASPKVYGTEITWTTTASGGSGDYLYKYWRKGPDTGGVYVSQRDWDASPDWLWTPGVAQIGSNSIKAIVRNASGGATIQTVKGFNVTYAPIVIQTFGATPVSPKPSGTSITWDATVTGGSGSYLYKYYRKGPDTGNVYTVARDWDASASWDWTPDAAQVGVSTIKLRVMNATGGGATEAVKGFRVTAPDSR